MVQEDDRRHHMPSYTLVQLPSGRAHRRDRLDHPELLPRIASGCRPGGLQCERLQDGVLLHDYGVAAGHWEFHMGPPREQVRAPSCLHHQLCESKPRRCPHWCLWRTSPVPHLGEEVGTEIPWGILGVSGILISSSYQFGSFRINCRAPLCRPLHNLLTCFTEVHIPRLHDLGHIR